MTCNEFDEIVDLMFADDLIDEITRQGAMKHSATCSVCTRRLSDERILSNGLTALSVETAQLEASPRVKTALQQVFAEKYGNIQNPGPVQFPENVVNFPAHRVRRRTILTLAAAASILVMLGLTWQLWLPVLTSGNSDVVANLELPVPTPTASLAIPAVVNDLHQEKPGQEKMIAKTEPSRSSRVRSTRREVARSEPQVEQADFIPLTYVSDTASLRSGTVVRVEVQRATLLSMGLPVNASRHNSLIKADLMVGDDGIARAIRFVQ